MTSPDRAKGSKWKLKVGEAWKTSQDLTLTVVDDDNPNTSDRRQPEVKPSETRASDDEGESTDSLPPQTPLVAPVVSNHVLTDNTSPESEALLHLAAETEAVDWKDLYLQGAVQELHCMRIATDKVMGQFCKTLVSFSKVRWSITRRGIE